MPSPIADDSDERRTAPARLLARAGWVALPALMTVLLSVALVFCVELVARGSLQSTLEFFRQQFRPGWATVALLAVLALLLDALIGRRHRSFLVIAPVLLTLAWIGSQKAHYLGDPLYPTDFLYARQIVELLPLLAAERPLVALLAGFLTALGAASLVAAWIFWRERFEPLSRSGRLWRLALAVPALAFFVSILDYASFSWARDRLGIIPRMWDQKDNYASNGFALAFALNVPMAKVLAPQGYSNAAIEAIPSGPGIAAGSGEDKPDIIMVMSESFWDPTRLPEVSIQPDPLPTVRAMQSGHVFSPEFGGMTANVEFEALTGFSNAFLPYGSIPYQQYVRGPTPSLASFLGQEGYSTAALHPFAGWFWNRTNVYEALGFDLFYDEAALGPLEKRGQLASDAALTEEIIRRAEAAGGAPVFLFAVSLQGHGPYEPNRYGASRHSVAASASEPVKQSLLSYVEGVADSDRSFLRLVEWAKARQRETILVFFGDHLPPLNKVYPETGFMKGPVPDRREPAAELSAHRETPLVIWSSRSGTVDTGTVSPAFIPLHVMRTAGFQHPFYTGFLAAVHDRFPVVDRHMLIARDGAALPDWSRDKAPDPLVRDYRLLQYDILFGKGHGHARFFPPVPETAVGLTFGRPEDARLWAGPRV